MPHDVPTTRVPAAFALFASLGLLAASLPAPASAKQCDSGLVFVDADGDGRRDRGEAPLPGARVSDGVRIVATDARGRYRLDVPDGRTLFLIKPAGYALPTRPDGLPDAFLNVQRRPGPALKFGGVPAAPGRTCRDFALRPRPAASGEALDVLVFGDPQPKVAAHVRHYARDIVEPLQGRAGATLALSLGDIVDDDLSLYPAMKRVDAGLGIPWLHAPGNHDVDFDAADDARSLDSFRHAYGPDTRAWEEHNANFIVLDDVIRDPSRPKGYVGGLREDQFAFLAEYLREADKARLLVLAMHIHLFDDKPGATDFRRADRDRLFALLAPFPKVLLLTAHAHTQRHVFHGAEAGWTGATPLHEYNVGAACGGYWTGVEDADGLPDATMADGTPNGSARMRVAAVGAYALRWFAARAPEDAGIGLHSPGVLRRGAYPAFGVFANVWMGRADTVVEFRVDGGAWKPMRRVLAPDPAMTAENARDAMAPALRAYDRAPEAEPSQHLWRGAVPTDLAAGDHRVEVRAQLPEGEVRADTRYRLEDAAPASDAPGADAR
jgi:3',5'-cyclic AMP phosphodiesterase CpdA